MKSDLFSYGVHSVIDGIQWPGLPGGAADGILGLLFQMEQNQWLSAEEIQRHQLKQLSALLEFCNKQIPYYRNKYDVSAGLSHGSWQQLPILTRDKIQEHAHEMQAVSLPAGHGRVADFSSSGSTGKPVQVKGSDLSHFFSSTLVVRCHIWHKRDIRGRLAAIRSNVIDETLPNWGGALATAFETGPCCTLNISHDVEEQAKWLVDEKPQYVISHPSNIEALAQYFLDNKLQLPALKQMRSFGEVLSNDIRGLCRQAWDVELTDAYSIEEAGTIALQCPEHHHYHVQSENIFVEILNDSGYACKPGEVGRVVVTPLHNFAMPLIRYELGDYAEVGEACSCGRGLPVLRRIMGRSRNMMHTPDGKTHWPSFPTEIWAQFPKIRQFQIVQEKIDTLRIRLRCDESLSEKEEGRLIDSLSQKLGYPFVCYVRYESEFEAWQGKREDFISLV